MTIGLTTEDLDSLESLWTSVHDERVTHAALRTLLRMRAQLAGLKEKPTPHDFRCAFALVMLRNGVDVFALQKLMGHSDLQVLRRNLAQTIRIFRMRICEAVL